MTNKESLRSQGYVLYELKNSIWQSGTNSEHHPPAKQTKDIQGFECFETLHNL